MIKLPTSGLASAYQSSTISSPVRKIPNIYRPSLQRSRRYARVSSSPAPDARSYDSHGSLHSWPYPEPPFSVPTPYQLLSAHKGQPYRKGRFYALVKIYHPDCSYSTTDVTITALPLSVRLERYRLLVAAHTLLSDPERRAIYDACGAGWNDAANESPGPDGKWPPGQDPMCNATWEDWEEWRARRAHHIRDEYWQKYYAGENGSRRNNRARTPRSTPSLVHLLPNGVFFALISALAALGGIVQASRVEQLTESRAEKARLVHRMTSADLAHAREQSRNLGREGGLNRFLKEQGHPQLSELATPDTDAEAFSYDGIS